MLFGVERQEAQQVQCVCVIGFRGKRLLTADLRIEMPSGSHMRKTGLVKRRRVADARLVSRLGAIGGRTFAD